MTPSVLEEVDDRVPRSPRKSIYSEGGEAVGVYASFHEADEDERRMIEEEEAAQPPLSLDAQLGSYASTAGDEEYEDEGEEIDEEAMEEARAEAAAVITEQLTQRMAAVTELQRRLESTLGRTQNEDGIAVDSYAAFEPPASSPTTPTTPVDDFKMV